VFLTNPVFKIWSAQNLILSPAPVHYLLAFGPLALLAAIGGWQTWKGGSARGLMLIGWSILAPVLVYLPFSLQRRLALGAQVPLSILAAAGLWRLLRAEEATRRWRSVSISLVTLLALSNVALLAGVGWEVSRRSPPIFQSQAEVSAADWLGAHTTPDQVVLAAFETGNYLPTRMSARVFAGHGPETIYADLKTDMLNRFFANGDDTFRTELLRDYGISYLFYGPAERALGNFSPEDASYLQQVYDNGRVQIYRVVR
jgi:asparagine N-glycosylation enzyme membrane subunit Stt3